MGVEGGVGLDKAWGGYMVTIVQSRRGGWVRSIG